jgi:succinoglycan biosynthesis protein ExoA
MLGATVALGPAGSPSPAAGFRYRWRAMTLPAEPDQHADTAEPDQHAEPGTDVATAAASGRSDVEGWPPVSVVMPILDEEHHLRDAVQHVLGQDYPGELEIVMALGPSTDRTDEIAAELAAEDHRVRSVPNPSGATGAGLNRAVASAAHDVVVRLDGHAIVATDYVTAAVRTLQRTGADNVGGLMAARGSTDFERAVAVAMTSPLGVGQSAFHVGGTEGPAETVYLGVFRRDALLRVGGYDETFLRAQDWELNHRIRASGGLVWFDPQLRVTYRPRSTMRALARQYRNYGRWRRVVMREHAGTATVRYLAPPVAVLVVAAGTVAGLAGIRVGFLAPAGYAVGVLAGSAVVGRRLPLRARVWLPPVIATMHASWGTGFLLSPRRLRSPT